MLIDKFLALRNSVIRENQCSQVLERYEVKSLIRALCEVGYSVSQRFSDRVDLLCRIIGDGDEGKGLVFRTERELWRWGKKNGMLVGMPKSADYGLLIGRSYSAPVVEFTYVIQHGNEWVLSVSVFSPETYEGRLSVDSLKSRGKKLQTDL